MNRHRPHPILPCGGIALALSGFLLVASTSCAGASAIPPTPPVAEPALAHLGWLDRNDDGRHDLFHDIEGDGVNDITLAPYAHNYGWSDLDADGLNDWFRDADGDGVNDLETVFRDRDGDGRDENVLDADGDGRNDVTGLAYAPGRLGGEKYGFVRDGEPVPAWIDEDGDGFADGPRRGRLERGREDRFIDRDGDGMADDCWFQDGGFRHQRARGGVGGHGGGPGDGQGGGGQHRGRPW